MPTSGRHSRSPVSSLPGLQEITLRQHTVPVWCTGALVTPGMLDAYY